MTLRLYMPVTPEGSESTGIQRLVKRDWRQHARLPILAQKSTLVIRAPQLPVTEQDQNCEQHQRHQRRPQGRIELPFAYAHDCMLICREPLQNCHTSGALKELPITTLAQYMFSDIVILVILFAIIVSLFSGMYFMLRDRGRSTRMVKALTVRIILSLVLFALLMIGYWAGWLHPHGLLPPRH